jgi:hypothetical protein
MERLLRNVELLIIFESSGRVDFKQNKFRITPEIEYTGATWGDLKKMVLVQQNK